MQLKQLFARSLAAGFVATVCLTGVAHATPVRGDTVNIPALTLMDGQHRPEGYYDGKPVIIQYWASWCPFCARQNPYLQRLSENAQGTDLEILAISIDRQEVDARQYLQDKQYTFPAAMETPELLDMFGKRRVIPEIFVITSEGKVAEVIPGEMFEEDVLELIKYASDTKQ